MDYPKNHVRVVVLIMPHFHRTCLVGNPWLKSLVITVSKLQTVSPAALIRNFEQKCKITDKFETRHTNLNRKGI